MRKEIFVAVILGLFLGLIIAFGIYRTNRTINNKVENNQSLTTDNQSGSIEKDNETIEEFKLTISKPENLGGIIENPVMVAGLTKPNSLVISSGETEDTITLSNNNGAFENSTGLIGGINQILVKSYSNELSTDEKLITLVYSNEFIKQLISEITPSSTTSATIDDAVNQKVELTKANPKTYLGSITDVTETTLQLKNSKSEIQLISIGENTTFARIGKTTVEIKQNDIAIGDYIAVLGTVNGQKVMNAKRILLVSPPEYPTRKIFVAINEKYSKASLSLQYDGNIYTLPYNKTIKVTTLENGEIVKAAYSDIENGDRLIIIGTIKDKIISARRIHIEKITS